MFRHFSKIVFAGGVLVMTMLYGVAAGRYDLFPAPVLNDAADAARDWRGNWKHYLRLRPDKQIYPARYDGEGVVVHDAKRAQDGATLIAGLFDDRMEFRLVDMAGEELHRWQISVNETFPNQSHLEQALHDWDSQMHGMVLLENGDILFNFERVGLVRIDRCSNIVWARPNFGHHSVFLDHDDTIWISAVRGVREPDTGFPGLTTPVYDETILQLSLDGEVLREISVLDSIYQSRHAGLLLAKGRTNNTHTGDDGMDLLHLNDVEVLSPSLAAAFPQFEAGDILISLRNVNTILVLDRETTAVKWSATGPFIAQHDPDFLADGTISVFDNHRYDGNRTGSQPLSRIVAIDPATSEVTRLYGGTSDQGFFTHRMGKHQHLANGNILIAESEGGRVFEVTQDGDIVWSYVNRWDEDEVALIVEAERFLKAQVSFVEAPCPSSGTS